MLEDIFKIISFYDEVRWSSTSNYNLINFYRNNLDNDTKLLTHWLCYITDRQMSFGRIWDVGGFIFSELSNNFKKNGKLNILNPNDDNTFIKNYNNGYVFISNSNVSDNIILKRSYNFKETDKVTFTPRYYPSDYFSILYTLDILKHFDNSLIKFLIEQLHNHHNTDDYIKRILFSLYLLTYYKIGQPNKADIEKYLENIEKAKTRTEKVLTVLNDVEIFDLKYRIFKKDKIFYQKRAWCSLRDFLKSPEFKIYFRDSLIKHNVNREQTEQLFSLKSYQQLELPGDVWNNNSKFRNCILENTEYQNSNKSLNKILREFFDKNKNILGECYPEQFDITFDFVPRMCESDNCNICPIGKMKGIPNSNYDKTCVNNTNLFCSVALINCNYKLNCFGDKCRLKKTMPNHPLQPTLGAVR